MNLLFSGSETWILTFILGLLNQVWIYILGNFTTLIKSSKHISHPHDQVIKQLLMVEHDIMMRLSMISWIIKTELSEGKQSNLSYLPILS